LLPAGDEDEVDVITDGRNRVKNLAVLVLIMVMTTLAVACGGDEDNELVIMTHDSFDISEELIAQFEAANDATVVLQPVGDAGAALVRAILEKGNPSADLLYGIDNTYLGRALEAGIFEEYRPDLMDEIPARLVLDTSGHVTSIDYGFVNLNYDIAYLAEHGLTPPTTLEELTGADWKGRLVVEDPASSSPGLAFLIATVSYFGEDDDYDYLDFWRDLRANDVLVKDGWTAAYYTDFSQYGGDRPLVVSYATSPAAEFLYSAVPVDVPPTGNILIDKASFLQIEGIGILKGANSTELAKKFIDFALGTSFQEDFPEKMFVYPVNPNASTPDSFRFAEVPSKPSDIGAAEIGEKREQWIQDWTEVVLR
jgi:thiamine transport system substrate-binding protein